MAKYKHFKITNDGDDPFTFKVKAGSRFEETWEKLLRGPVPAPALTRRSDHIFHFRKSGVAIETEFIRQSAEGPEKYGVYHLRSRVERLKDGEAV